MGEVFAATHRSTGAEVALKIVTAARTRGSFLGDTFSGEVRAVARLDHPGIVRVLDHGRVTEQEAAAAGVLLPDAAPWLALERASGGTLHERAGRLAWPTMQVTLARILAALAHAHARGVLHRDLKPANVLVRTALPDVAVSDFGLAHALDTGAPLDGPSRAHGTPAYMAPEQIAGQWRDFGPWTDLFALGCVAWELATGRPPFDSDRGARPFVVPALNPVTPVPAGFRSWVLRLLAPDPAERFARAADAAFALEGLTDPAPARRPVGVEPARPEPPETLPCATPSRTREVWRREEDATDAASRSAELARASSRPSSQDGSTEASPTPRSWPGDKERLPVRAVGARPPARPPLPGRAPRTESGAGAPELALYGLRAVPLVGREAERDALWEALFAVERDRRARAVVLEGPAGVGKSRLCEWLCEQAHELGAATPVRILHGPAAAPAHGLGAALARVLRTAGLERGAAARRIESTLRALGADLADREDLADLVCPSSASASAPGVRRAAAARLLAAMASERPVILWIDDAPWGADALSFATEVLGTTHPCGGAPILIVLTARTDHLAERPTEAERLAALDARHLEIAPLPPSDRDALVRSLARLDDPLAARVRDRTAGNPLFAVHLVGDWIARGLLEPGARGHRLRPGVHAELPDDLHAVWARRIERVLEGGGDDDRVALELAARLGGVVDEAEWRDACAAAGVVARPDLVDALEAQGLARRVRDAESPAWDFAHGMLRESLVRRSAEAGRGALLDGACAEMLEHRRGPGVAERLGRHCIGAGRLAAALGPLDLGARERMAAGDPGGAEALAAEHAAALDGLGLGPDDARRAAAELLAADMALFRGRPADALPRAHRAATLSSAAGDRVTCAAALCARGTASRRMGDLAGAERAFGAAMEVAAEAGDRRRSAMARAQRAWVIGARGDLSEAARELRRTRAALLALGDEEASAGCALHLGSIAARTGRLRAARTWIENARRCFERLGDRERAAIAVADLAEVARTAGDLETAERGTREALGRLRALGAGSAPVAAANLALVLVLRGRPDEARALAEPLVDELDQAGRRLLLPVVEACLLACAAEARDGRAWELRMGRVEARATDAGYADPDLALALGHAAKRAAANGWTARAARARAAAQANFGTRRPALRAKASAGRAA